MACDVAFEWMQVERETAVEQPTRTFRTTADQLCLAYLSDGTFSGDGDEHDNDGEHTVTDAAAKVCLCSSHAYETMNKHPLGCPRLPHGSITACDLFLFFFRRFLLDPSCPADSA